MTLFAVDVATFSDDEFAQAEVSIFYGVARSLLFHEPRCRVIGEEIDSPFPIG